MFNSLNYLVNLSVVELVKSYIIDQNVQDLNSYHLNLKRNKSLIIFQGTFRMHVWKILIESILEE